MSSRTRVQVLILILCFGVLPCLGKPNLKQKTRDAQIDVPKLLQEGDLRLKRLFLAVSAADFPLVTQELDNAVARYTELKQKLQSSGPAWNTPKANQSFGYLEKALDFARFQVELRYGSATNLEQRVDEFLAIPELNTGQRMIMLLAAARASYQRGQLTQAQKFVTTAEDLASKEQVSPVALFNLRTTKFYTSRIASPEPAELKSGFEHAWEPLVAYKARQNPLHDAGWLLAREASRYWIEQFTLLGPEGIPELEIIYRKAVEMNENSTPWDNKKLQSMGFNFPFNVYIQKIAELSVLSASVDQILSASEAFSAEQLVQNDCQTKLDQIELLMAGIPTVAQLHCNAKIHPNLATFELGEGGVIQEIRGRSLFLKARFADDQQKAELLSQGLQAILKSGHKPTQVQYLFKAADALDSLGQTSKALDAWNQALKIATESGLTLRILDAREKLAKHHLAQKEWPQVKEHAQEGLNTLREALPFVGEDSRAATELANRSRVLSALIAQSSLGTNDTSSALAALNMGGEMSVAASQMTAQEVAQIEEVKEKKKKVVLLTEQVETLQEMPPSHTRDALLQENEKLLADTKAEFLTESRKIREENSALYSSVLRFDPLDLPDVQGVIPPNSAVIQYFPTDAELYIFVVSRDSFVLRSVDISSRTLDDKIVALLSSVTRPGLDNENLDKLRRELYDALIQPVEPDITGRDTLVLIPAGRLNFLPFAILQNEDGKALLDDKLLLELAKPTDFLRIASSEAKPVSSVVAYANATLDLPAAAVEGATVTELFEGSQLFEGEDANKDNFFAHGGSKDVLHLATHGQWDMADALKSHLKLANGQKINQKDVFEMDLGQTTLVTLSACNTALSQRHDVDFVASLAEAFWIAGSRSVVATLWSVDDDSTGVLMSEFYRGLKEGKGKSESLRDAQLKVKETPRFEHPYFWGGVMLFGDWR